MSEHEKLITKVLRGVIEQLHGLKCEDGGASPMEDCDCHRCQAAMAMEPLEAVLDADYYAEVEAYHAAADATCIHDKCFSPNILCSFPPQRPWVCRKCLAKGTDRDKAHGPDEYANLIRESEKRRA